MIIKLTLKFIHYQKLLMIAVFTKKMMTNAFLNEPNNERKLNLIKVFSRRVCTFLV